MSRKHFEAVVVDPPSLFSLALLGPTEALLNGKPVAVAQTTARALLAYLAVGADRPHSREVLAGMFWPDQPQATAYTNLRQTLARLRRSSADLGAFLLITPQTLQFNRAGAWVDVVQFTDLLAECAQHAHLDAAACPACHERFVQAAALYRGELLHGLSLETSQPFEEWLLLTRETFHRQALDLFHILVEAAEKVGDYAQMRFYATRQLTLEPWREEAHGQVMRALAYSGQRAAALAQYEHCRQTLRAEFGVEPSPELAALYEQIREGTLRRTPAEPKQRPAYHTNAPESAQDTEQTPGPQPESQTADAPLARQIEQPLTPFVGRERELGEIVTWLQQPHTRLLTLLGAGGMGKTRLALAAAEALFSSFPDGVFVVSLASLGSSSAIVPAIAAALGLSLHGSEPQRALMHMLRSKNMLLVLDNFEHLLDGVRIVVELLQTAPDVRVLATSRERLNVRGEHVYAVRGMEYTPNASLHEVTASSAVSLFVQSARRVLPDFQIDATNLAAVLRVCQLVQGMPLGLELAAAWAELLPPQAIAAEIERSADFLAHEWRDAPDRHRSMRGVFEWSWGLLTGAERHVFKQLTVFRGGFTYEAAQAIAGGSPQVLTRLLHKSLLSRSEAQAGMVRYEIHELLRQFAAEQLDAEPHERSAVEARHSAFYLAFVAARERRIAGNQPLEASSELQTEIDNIRQAWTSQNTQPNDIDHAAFSLYQFYHHVGLFAEAERVFHAAAERAVTRWQQAPTSAPEKRAMQALASKLLGLHAVSLFGVSRFNQALEVARQAIRLAEDGVSLEGEVLGNVTAGRALNFSAQYLEARPYLERARRLSSEALQTQAPSTMLLDAEWTCYLYLGAGSMMLGDYVAARSHFNTGLELSHRSGLMRGEMTCLLNMADIDRDQCNFAAAQYGYEAGLRIARRIGSRWGEATAELELGNTMRCRGNYGYAGELLSRALHRFHAMNNSLKEALALCRLGSLHTDLGNYAGAHEWFDQSRDLLRTIHAPDAEADVLAGLAHLALQQGYHEQALVHAEYSLKINRTIKSMAGQVDALLIIGHARAALQQLAAANEAYQHALELCETLDRVSPAAEARAGLASVALQQGDRSAAFAYVEVIVDVLANQARIGLTNPFYVYRVCWSVLHAWQDRRAATVLQEAQRLLRAYAGTIADDALRHTFLTRAASQHELLAHSVR